MAFQVEGSEEEKGDKSYVDLKRVVWHDCFTKLLAVLEARKGGEKVACADGIERVLVPVILILSADYEEQYVIFQSFAYLVS